jgi:hypothetical protein
MNLPPNPALQLTRLALLYAQLIATVGSLVIVNKAVEILEYVCYDFCQVFCGTLIQTNGRRFS